MIVAVLRALLGGGGLLKEARAAFGAALAAQTDGQAIAAKTQWRQIDAAVRLAEVSAAAPLSAVSLGRYLVVIPFGIWWAAIFLDSVIGASWDVLALPPQIAAMAEFLIPAILLADVADRIGSSWRAGK
jgi:hypothetical protein